MADYFIHRGSFSKSVESGAQAVCGLFSNIESDVAACKAWIEGGPAPAPPPSAPSLRDRAALDAHLNRRLVDTERKARDHTSLRVIPCAHDGAPAPPPQGLHPIAAPFPAESFMTDGRP